MWDWKGEGSRSSQELAAVANVRGVPVGGNAAAAATGAQVVAPVQDAMPEECPLEEVCFSSTLFALVP